MRRMFKLAVATSVAAVAGLVVGALPASATPPTGYGFDNVPNVVVGGGSDTTYPAMLNLTKLYMQSAISGCPHVTAIGSTLNDCSDSSPNPQPNTNLGDYDGDTFTQANPVGSSAGVASLNGAPNSSTSYVGAVRPTNYTCPGTSTVITTTGANVDFARSSRAPKTSSGNSVCTTNELDSDTFWGFAQDGVQVIALTSTRGADLQGVGGSSLTPDQLFNIWNCTGGSGAGGQMIWSDLVPSLLGTPRGDALVVPWGMNSSSGTFATFQTFIQNNASGVPTGWSPDGQACDRKLQSGLFPLENDIKNIVNDPTTLSTDPASADNPDNWLWWGSFGAMSAFPYLSNYTRAGSPTIPTIATPSPVNGILPSTSGIIANTYPIGRTLYHVTLKPYADCPKTGTACDFPGHVGPLITGTTHDLNVTGATNGVRGAVREFTRFLCRASTAQHGLNPYTGNNNFNEITSAINTAGFTVVPASLRTSGSRCDVLS